MNSIDFIFIWRVENIYVFFNLFEEHQKVKMLYKLSEITEPMMPLQDNRTTDDYYI